MKGETTEMSYYHHPFTFLGDRHRLRSPVDEALLQIHNDYGATLRNISPHVRKQLVIDIVNDKINLYRR